MILDEAEALLDPVSDIDGYLAVYPPGDSAIVAVTGTSSMNVAMLQYRARGAIERIGAHATQIGAQAALVQPMPEKRNGRTLPRRRPAAPESPS